MKLLIKQNLETEWDEMIHKSYENSCYIVCRDFKTSAMISERAAKLKIEIPFPLSYSDFRDKRYYGIGINGFILDDIDCFLQSFSNVPINIITIKNHHVSNIK